MSPNTAVDVQGTADPAFHDVADAFAANFADHGEIGAACAVYVDGEPVVDIWGGMAEIEPPRRWERDTLVWVASTTKGAVAVCANQLIEQGPLDAGVSSRTFGHIGAGGSTAFADPDRGLTFCYVMNQMKMIDMARADALVAATYVSLP